MGFRTIVVNEHSKLSYKNNHLIFKSATTTELIHLTEIDTLILETTDIAITSMLIAKLTEYNVLTIFCDSTRLPITKLMPYYGRHDTSLQIKKQLEWTISNKSEVWLRLLYQKLYNQRQLLRQLDYDEQARSITKLIDNLELDDPSNREAHAARLSFNTLFGNQFSREQDNDINASLNYGYTLLMSLFAREIVKCGCLTQPGVGHTNQFNDFNLASDIMEPFRVLVDEIVYHNKDKEFPVVKRELLKLFTRTYRYENADMYLNNIARKYTRQLIDYLHEDGKKAPEFLK